MSPPESDDSRKQIGGERLHRAHLSRRAFTVAPLGPQAGSPLGRMGSQLRRKRAPALAPQRGPDRACLHTGISRLQPDRQGGSCRDRSRSSIRMRHGPLPGAGMMGSTGDPSLQGDPEAPAGGATLAGAAFSLGPVRSSGCLRASPPPAVARHGMPAGCSERMAGRYRVRGMGAQIGSQSGCTAGNWRARHCTVS